MKPLTKTNKSFLLVGLVFFVFSFIFYILAWLGQPSMEEPLLNLSSIAFIAGLVSYVLLGLKVITDSLKSNSHP